MPKLPKQFFFETLPAEGAADMGEWPLLIRLGDIILFDVFYWHVVPCENSQITRTTRSFQSQECLQLLINTLRPIKFIRQDSV
jgi:hypothetical protein